MARNAMRRTWRSQSASIGSVARTTEVAAASVHSASARASSSSAAAPGRSDSTSSSAAADRSSPRLCQSSTAAIVTRSISSSVHGSSPARVMAATAVPAASRVAKKASIVTFGGGAGRRRSVASVTMPSVPCEPTNEVRQRVAGHVLDVATAGADDAAVGEDDLERQHRVAGDAVLHAAQAAGVGADVAADRAELVARRVRRVEEALVCDRGLEIGVDDARLRRSPRGCRDRSRGSRSCRVRTTVSAPSTPAEPPDSPAPHRGARPRRGARWRVA